MRSCGRSVAVRSSSFDHLFPTGNKWINEIMLGSSHSMSAYPPQATTSATFVSLIITLFFAVTYRICPAPLTSMSLLSALSSSLRTTCPNHRSLIFLTSSFMHVTSISSFDLHNIFFLSQTPAIHLGAFIPVLSRNIFYSCVRQLSLSHTSRQASLQSWKSLLSKSQAYFCSTEHTACDDGKTPVHTAISLFIELPSFSHGLRILRLGRSQLTKTDNLINSSYLPCDFFHEHSFTHCFFRTRFLGTLFFRKLFVVCRTRFPWITKPCKAHQEFVARNIKACAGK